MLITPMEAPEKSINLISGAPTISSLTLKESSFCFPLISLVLITIVHLHFPKICYL
ncbi:MAG: hypothetical protein LBS83_03345 [Holosporales bacterium]|nr:hypothetical protein [Holosporales bacterium]